ncbi:small acid-soluble spore protein SspI [Thermovenabulum gondwanense]|uniref:Small, acid-soluble spore protein I n=1 Tax=Thermovenabulum gondwanense TaxID=520767 RepID=A0A162N3N6_9FIRM|nr:small acid-soluble spore protein SspI [Thermovenabulum gondwanense]KYO69168.1 Small, acid-soluble spore protein I [Thermovenabulum gondwanense]
MNFDIRDLVMKNLAGSTKEEVEGYIKETIEEKEDDALPGMGVLFEVVWKKSTEDEKNKMMDKIMSEINKK